MDYQELKINTDKKTIADGLNNKIKQKINSEQKQEKEILLDLFKEESDNYFNFYKEEISRNYDQFAHIYNECYELEKEINIDKKCEIIEKIKLDHKSKKDYFREIKDITNTYGVYFKLLKKNSSFKEQKKELTKNEKLINKIENILLIQENLIKINKIYEETKNKFLFYNDVNNIAITGPYGSGKSSIINTYLDRDSDLQKSVIRITLAHFSYANISNPAEKSEESCSILKENAIEEEIISELVYQIKPNDIYLSPYKIKKNKKLLLCLLTSASTLLCLLYLFLVIFLSFKCNENFFCESDFWKNILIFSPLTFLLIPTFYLTLKYKSEVTKIKLLNQIDIDFKQEKCNLSKFDKEYRELVYIIKNSEKRIIIFEDFDRLENFNFLTKLRKINDILNRDKSLKSTRFKFIYVMKDDLFIKPEDKTKFFDLIIPIVPFKNIDNIKNIFKKSLSKFFENNEFILNISEYIGDNRLAVNICNEFNIYFKKIKTNFAGADIDLNMEDFFLLIVFKNIFPELFKLVFLNNKKYLLTKDFNGDEKYKELYEHYYLKFNNISYYDFYTYTSDYFVEESDKNWLIYLNKSNEKFYSWKHNLTIKDLDYIIRFSKLNLVKNREIKEVMRNVDFINKILFKLAEDSIKLNPKENELIFNYLLMNEENSKKVLAQLFKENEKTQKLTFNFLMNFFTNIIKNDYPKYKNILFNILISSKELNPNIFLLLKITFLYSLIFFIENNHSQNLFTEEQFQNFLKEMNKKEKKFLLFLNSNSYSHHGMDEFIIDNNRLLESIDLYNEKYIKCLGVFINKNLFTKNKGIQGINYYFENQKYFLQLDRILYRNQNYFNYGRILSELKLREEYKNIYNYYFEFWIDNFIYFLADVISRTTNFVVSEDEDIILQILNSDKLINKYKEIYISYINRETLNKIDSKDIKKEEIRIFFDHIKKTKNRFQNNLS